jgi:hypothetical protein
MVMRRPKKWVPVCRTCLVRHGYKSFIPTFLKSKCIYCGREAEYLVEVV